MLVGAAVHSAISTIGEFGRDLESGANGVADNLGGASERTHNIPLLGDALSDPLSAAGDAARGIAGAGHNLDTTTGWMSWLLALAVAAPPILAVAMPWLFLRLRFFRRKWTAVTLAGPPPANSCWRCARWPTGHWPSWRRSTPTRWARGAARTHWPSAGSLRSNSAPPGFRRANRR